MVFAKNLVNKLIVLFTFISLSPAVFGGTFTKVSLVILILLNFKYSITYSKIKYISFLIILISSLTLKSLILGDKIDISIVVFFLNILFLISLFGFDFDRLKPYFSGILISVIFGFIASVIAIAIGSGEFYVTLANKGFIDIYSVVGFTKIPQTYGSLCIILFVIYTNKNKKISNLFFMISLFTINRVTLLTGIILKIINNKRYYPIFIFLVMLLMFVLFILSPSFDLLNNVQTLSSRFDMIFNIMAHIREQNVFDFIFGSFSIPDFEIYKNSQVNYIENGFMFILYYFGVFGILLYFSFSLFVMYVSYKKNIVFFCYAILLTIIIPNFTHEYLFPSFYLALSILLAKKIES